MKTLKRVLLVLVFFILMILFNQSHVSGLSVSDFLNNPLGRSGDSLVGEEFVLDKLDTSYSSWACLNSFGTENATKKVIRTVIDISLSGGVTVYGSRGTVSVKDSSRKTMYKELGLKCFEGNEGGIHDMYHDYQGTFSSDGVYQVDGEKYEGGFYTTPTGSMSSGIRMIIFSWIPYTGSDGTHYGGQDRIIWASCYPTDPGKIIVKKIDQDGEPMDGVRFSLTGGGTSYSMCTGSRRYMHI